MRTIFILFFVLLFAFPGRGLQAMSSSNYAVPSDNMSGGGNASTSANYGLYDSVGQTVTGAAASSLFSAEQGYVTAPNNPELSVSFVDNNGAFIVAPTVAFTDVPFGTSATSGKLTTSSSKIRVTNTRAVAPWSVTIAATNGPAALWSNGADYMNFNAPGSALTVNTTDSEVRAVNSCTTNDVTVAPSATFNLGTVDSITLLTAGGSAEKKCAWDLVGTTLEQTIPKNQPTGAYSISMTITVS